MTENDAIRVVDRKINSEMKNISPLFILPEYRNKRLFYKSKKFTVLMVGKRYYITGNN